MSVVRFRPSHQSIALQRPFRVLELFCLRFQLLTLLNVQLLSTVVRSNTSIPVHREINHAVEVRKFFLSAIFINTDR